MTATETAQPQHPIPAGNGWASEHPLRQEDLLWAIGSLCSVHRIPFEPSLIREQYAPPHSLATLLTVLRDIGLELRHAQPAVKGLPTFQLPALALLQPAIEAEVKVLERKTA